MNSPDIKWEKEIIWEKKKPVSSEQVKSFSYTHEENLIFTTAEDRKVIIWDASNGNFIESLKQNKDENGAKPIAYRKFGTKSIFSIDK